MTNGIRGNGINELRIAPIGVQRGDASTGDLGLDSRDARIANGLGASKGSLELTTLPSKAAAKMFQASMMNDQAGIAGLLADPKMTEYQGAKLISRPEVLLGREAQIERAKAIHGDSAFAEENMSFAKIEVAGEIFEIIRITDKAVRKEEAKPDVSNESWLTRAQVTFKQAGQSISNEFNYRMTSAAPKDTVLVLDRAGNQIAQMNNGTWSYEVK